jgi:outer membrane receptor for ferric coprogen and ferric-rhodotorulic acid
MVELSPYRGNPHRSFFFQIVLEFDVQDKVDLPIGEAYQRMDQKKFFLNVGMLLQLHLLIERSTSVTCVAYHRQ